LCSSSVHGTPDHKISIQYFNFFSMPIHNCNLLNSTI
jgi:hypothetical protein